MKKILVLNAGHTEVPIIEELKKMGNYVEIGRAHV